MGGLRSLHPDQGAKLDRGLGSAIAFDAADNALTCSGRKTFRQFNRAHTTQRTGITKASQRIYRATKLDCDVLVVGCNYQ